MLHVRVKRTHAWDLVFSAVSRSLLSEIASRESTGVGGTDHQDNAFIAERAIETGLHSIEDRVAFLEAVLEHARRSLVHDVKVSCWYTSQEAVSLPRTSVFLNEYDAASEIPR